VSDTWTDFCEELSPAWLRGFWGVRLVAGSFGVVFDALRDMAVTAIKSPLVFETDLPVDAIPIIGKSSNLERYATETLEAYTTRLQERWPLWERGGNHYPILRTLALFGFDNVSLVTPFNFAMEPIGYISQFKIYVPLGGHSFGDNEELGGGANLGDDGLRLGITDISSEEVRGLRALVEKFRPAHVICRGYLFQTAVTPKLGDPGLDLGDVGIELGSSYAEIGINGV
jgi:hypothetical protein